MEWINYHHLYYFWLSAKLGSISKASKELKLKRPTVSAQISQLQESLGQALFRKHGRGNVLTKFGQEVFSYADDIFTTGQKLKDFITQKPSERQREVKIGVSDILPKFIAYKLIAPLLEQFNDIRLVCIEGNAEKLVSELALNNLDAILCDVPVGRQVDARVFHHKLGECALSFFCPKGLLKDLSKDFPHCLSDIPMLLPSRKTSIRRSINLWMDSLGLEPYIIGEFDDSALMKVFGQNGVGVFVSPKIMEDYIAEQFDSVAIGSIDSIKDSFYLVSSKKNLEDDYMKMLVDTAKSQLFS